MHFQVDNVTAVVDSYREVEVMLHETLWRYNETSRPNTFSFYGQSAPRPLFFVGKYNII